MTLLWVECNEKVCQQFNIIIFNNNNNNNAFIKRQYPVTCSITLV